MKRWIDRLEWIQLRMAAGFFLLFIGCVILQVASRYLPGVTVLWAPEVATYAFIWTIFMGAAIMVRRQEHFRFDMLVNRLKGRSQLVARIVIHMTILAFGFVLFGDGTTLTQQFWAWSLNSLPQVKQGYVWLAIPVSGITMMIYAIANIRDDIHDYKRKEGELTP
ncbi:MAG: TRAP transporter small permease [Firmicutes bacterium]|jgi:TRAP-type C4-dicarboxylate transport system permease small subunit|uniref:TRAP-type C4-dicarboxylate transport system, small permease component n=1 Tax=Melghirimyces thermohalophilus TaxID=1236220 RepID=A0A1G6NUD7_9BACL|nr:TRAP transporter small permease [Melghirimyces thermohalophilus]MDA8352323.1 TRAP transporter small permease [Bacillota bacterium]SDC71563.1 TRAP-type C4-dicarboxylate transport system, small permease component [Melghirimyces thermohalophilus]